MGLKLPLCLFNEVLSRTERVRLSHIPLLTGFAVANVDCILFSVKGEAIELEEFEEELANTE